MFLSRRPRTSSTLALVGFVTGTLLLGATYSAAPAATGPTGLTTTLTQQQAAPSPSPRPSGPVTVEPVPSRQAAAELAAAIQPVKGQSVTVTSASGYNGSLWIPVPAVYATPLASTVTAGGTALKGLYNGSNQAVTVEASVTGGSWGELTLLAEPKTAMPNNAERARLQLKQSFAGVSAALVLVKGSPDAYIFTATNGSTVYSLAFILTNGTPVAYAMTGSGAYAPVVPRN